MSRREDRVKEVFQYESHPTMHVQKGESFVMQIPAETEGPLHRCTCVKVERRPDSAIIHYTVDHPTTAEKEWPKRTRSRRRRA